jgi:hypothetical protein
MEPFGKSVTESFNLTEMCVEYIPFSKKGTMAKERIHKFTPLPIRLPEPISESFIAMTGLSVEKFRSLEMVNCYYPKS